MPILFITGKNGKEVTLSESTVIEHYLAGHFNLLGDNAYDATVIRAIHNSAADLQTIIFKTILFNYPGAKKKSLEAFKTRTLPDTLAFWERHLVDNGSNGFFFGDRLSLADIRVANVLEHLSIEPEADDLLAIVSKYPHVFKLRELVANHPNLVEWRESKTCHTFYNDMRVFMTVTGPK
ncbi:hypothetical protein BGZ81_001778 [Podila clonocystis]|nr:hypothetical protein BGZ81_001778 [Podila clonocystis]